MWLGEWAGLCWSTQSTSSACSGIGAQPWLCHITCSASLRTNSTDGFAVRPFSKLQTCAFAIPTAIPTLALSHLSEAERRAYTAKTIIGSQSYSLPEYRFGPALACAMRPPGRKASPLQPLGSTTSSRNVPSFANHSVLIIPRTL